MNTYKFQNIWIFLYEVTENDINTIIGNFNNSSPGWDELKPSLIKMIKNYVKTPLTHICNRSFETGIFPNELKVANVVPIFKSGDEMLFPIVDLSQYYLCFQTYLKD